MPDYTALLQKTQAAYDEACHLASVPDLASQLQQLLDRIVGLNGQLTDAQTQIAADVVSHAALQAQFDAETVAKAALQGKIDTAKAALA